MAIMVPIYGFKMPLAQQLDNTAISCTVELDHGTESTKCELGPVTKSYGKFQWLVYSCSDEKSVVVVSAPGSPAMPYYFFLSKSGNGITLRGEGTGTKSLTESAYDDLRRLTPNDLEDLIKETERMQQ